MKTIRLLPLVALSLSVLSVSALAQISGGTTGAAPSGPSAAPSASPTPPTANPSAVPGATATTAAGPAANSSVGASAARANGTCPVGTMTDYAVGPMDVGRCKPISGVSAGSSSTTIGQPPSIMAPPATSGAR